RGRSPGLAGAGKRDGRRARRAQARGRSRGLSRGGGAGGAAPLPAPVAVELRRGDHVLSARLVHHEVQPGGERGGRAAARAGAAASAAAAVAGTRRARALRGARARARRGRRPRRRHAAAGGRPAGRPAGAGAEGELLGMLMVRAYHTDQGDPRRRVLIPASAHGTNPASSALCGYEVTEVPVGPRGLLEARAVASLMDEHVAALMVTNPN